MVHETYSRMNIIGTCSLLLGIKQTQIMLSSLQHTMKNINYYHCISIVNRMLNMLYNLPLSGFEL